MQAGLPASQVYSCLSPCTKQARLGYKFTGCFDQVGPPNNQASKLVAPEASSAYGIRPIGGVPRVGLQAYPL